jgi:DNA-binding transcriptional LysR family regulator
MQYAIQIAAERSFSRAAEKLHIAQPSLSQQLSKLEKELGVLLFKRSTNTVELTHAGTVFVNRARQIVDMAEQLRREMEDLAELRKGRVVVGSVPVTGAHLLPSVLPAFRAAYPDIEVVLIEETSKRLEELTISGNTDLCLLSLPINEPALAYFPVLEEEICLAVPPEHPLSSASAGKKTVPLKRLRNEPFILLKKGQGFRAIAHQLCAQAGFEPRIVFESGNIDTVQALVAAGMGISFVPHMVIRKDWPDRAPVYLPLENRPTRTLVIAYRKGRYLSNAAEAFIATFKQTMRAFHGRSESTSF